MFDDDEENYGPIDDLEVIKNLLETMYKEMILYYPPSALEIKRWKEWTKECLEILDDIL